MDSSVSKAHVRLRLEAVCRSLTPAERRLSEFIQLNAEATLHMTISELARAAQVSDATVTRLCQSVGYLGYSEFRVLLARDLALPQRHVAGELKSTDAVDDIRDKLIAGSIASLEGTRDLLDLNALRQAAEVIAVARRVDIYGIGGSAAVAQDMRHKLLRLGIAVSACDDVDIMSISSATLSSSDVVIGVSHTGRSEPVVASVHRAGLGGASIVALTQDPISPLAKASDFVLSYAAKPTAFSSDALSGRLAQLVIADMLYAVIAYSKYEQTAPLIHEANVIANQRRIN